jgi:hypothetical protein
MVTLLRHFAVGTVAKRGWMCVVKGAERLCFSVKSFGGADAISGYVGSL